MKERRITMTEVKPDVSVHSLREGDLSEADRIMRLAFGTFLGLPDTMTFIGDAGYVRTRWLTAPDAAFGAALDSKVIGSNFATSWGSVGFFGPLTVEPDLWNKGIGSRLMEPIEECFANWGTRHEGLFTWSHSPSHIHLYEKFGFWARFLTAIMSKSIRQRLLEGVDEPPSQWSRFSTLSESDKEEVVEACRELTNTIYDGLDLAGEIRAIDTQGLGDTLLLWDDARLVGFAAYPARGQQPPQGWPKEVHKDQRSKKHGVFRKLVATLILIGEHRRVLAVYGVPVGHL